MLEVIEVTLVGVWRVDVCCAIESNSSPRHLQFTYSGQHQSTRLRHVINIPTRTSFLTLLHVSIIILFLAISQISTEVTTWNNFTESTNPGQGRHPLLKMRQASIGVTRGCHCRQKWTTNSDVLTLLIRMFFQKYQQI